MAKTIASKLVELKNQDGSFRGLIDHSDGRVYDKSGEKLLEHLSPNHEVDMAMSDFANKLDRARLSKHTGKPVLCQDRGGQERLVTMDLAIGDVHVDAIGAQFLGGYQLGEAVADIVAPIITTTKASNKFPIWDAPNTFRRVLPTGNSPGGQVGEVSPTLSVTAYATVEYALATFVTTEVSANADAPISPYQFAVKRLMDALVLEREIRVMTLMQAPGTWNANNVNTVLSANKWDGGAGSDPLADLQLILQRSVMPVTRIIWSELVDQTFSKNPNVQNKIYAKSGISGIPNGSDFSELLHLPPITVSKMKYFASGTAASYVWGNHVVLVHEAGNVQMDDVATAKTFRWTGNPSTPDGQLMSGGWLFRSFFDNRRGGRGGQTAVLVHNDAEVVTSNIVGGLILNAYQ